MINLRNKVFFVVLFVISFIVFFSTTFFFTSEFKYYDIYYSLKGDIIIDKEVFFNMNFLGKFIDYSDPNTPIQYFKDNHWILSNFFYYLYIFSHGLILISWIIIFYSSSKGKKLILHIINIISYLAIYISLLIYNSIKLDGMIDRANLSYLEHKNPDFQITEEISRTLSPYAEVFIWIPIIIFILFYLIHLFIYISYQNLIKNIDRISKMNIDILLFSPTTEELEEIQNVIPHPTLNILDNNIFPWPYDKGYLIIGKKKHIIHVISPQIAGQRIAQTFMNEALKVWKPNYVILTGVAGGIQKVNIGDILLPRKIPIFDLYKSTPYGQQPQPDSVEPTESLVMLAERYFINEGWGKKIKEEYFQHLPDQQSSNGCYADCNVVSSVELLEKVLEDKDALSKYLDFNRKLYGIEQEAAGIGEALKNTMIPWIDIRVVMDLADPDSRSGSKDLNKQQAAKLAADFSLGFIKYLIKQKIDIKEEKEVLTNIKEKSTYHLFNKKRNTSEASSNKEVFEQKPNLKLIHETLDMISNLKLSQKNLVPMLNKIHNEFIRFSSKENFSKDEFNNIKDYVRIVNKYLLEKDNNIKKIIIGTIRLFILNPKLIKLVQEMNYNYLNKLYESGYRTDDIALILFKCGKFKISTEIYNAIDKKDINSLRMFRNVLYSINTNDIEESIYKMIKELRLKIENLNFHSNRELIETIEIIISWLETLN